MKRCIHATMVVLLATVVSLLAASAPARADPDLLATLRQVQVLIAQPDRLSAPERATRARMALAELGGDPALANVTWLTDPLAANPPDLTQANARVAAALAALGDAPQQAIRPDARATLAAILHAPPFQPIDPVAALPSWLQPVARAVIAAANALGTLLQRLLDLLLTPLRLFFQSRAFGPAMAVLAVAVTAGVFLLYRHGLRAAIVGQAEIGPTGRELPPTAAEALTTARAQAAEGRYREACHYLLFSVLLWIEEHQAIRFDRAATNREHLRRLASEAPEPRANLLRAVEPVVRRFDQLWYGQATVTYDDYVELAALAERVREAAS